jgi:hypothetical protein
MNMMQQRSAPGMQGGMHGQMRAGVGQQSGLLGMPNQTYLSANGTPGIKGNAGMGGVQQIPSISTLSAGATSGMLLPSVVSGTGQLGGGGSMPMTLPSMSTLQWMNKGSGGATTPGSKGPSPTPGSTPVAPGTGSSPVMGAVPTAPVAAAATTTPAAGGGVSSSGSTSGPSAVTAQAMQLPPSVPTATTYVESKSEEFNKRQKI